MNTVGPSIKYGDELMSAVREVVRSGWYVRGQEVEAFEHEFADYCGTTYCVGVEF